MIQSEFLHPELFTEEEQWLLQNEDALRAVVSGLERAAAGEFSQNPPDLDADKPADDC